MSLLLNIFFHVAIIVIASLLLLLQCQLFRQLSESLIGFDVASKAFCETRERGKALLFCLLPYLEAIKRREKMNAVIAGTLGWRQKTWVLAPALHISSSVTLGKSPSPFGALIFSFLKMRGLIYIITEVPPFRNLDSLNNCLFTSKENRKRLVQFNNSGLFLFKRLLS